MVAPIGVGASATVYRALNEMTGDEVAIKVLAENHSLLPAMRQRFLDEVELLAAIDSPSVAKIYELGETENGQPFMVLELADRGDLRHRFEDLQFEQRSPGRMDLLALAEHLAVALSALHRVGIIHRDVSPGNVLIRTCGRGERGSSAVPFSVSGPRSRAELGGALDGQAVLEPGERYLLADLGFAKDLAYASGLTAGGGTRGFAAPEQREELTLVDHRADVFSATAVIEWMAQGCDVTVDIDGFLSAGLAHDPAQRFDSMEDWLGAFNRALAVESRPLDRGVAPTGQTWRSRWGLKLLAVGGALGIGLAGAVAVSRLSELDATASEETATEETSEIPVAELTPSQPEQSSSEASSATQATGSTPSTQADDRADSTVAEETADAAPSTTPTTAAIVGTGSVVVDTTVPPVASVTTLGLTTTTFDPRFTESPRAYIQSPADEAIVSGDLRIEGTAQYNGGINGVRLVIRNIETDLVWHDSTKSFSPVWERFLLPVSAAGPTEATWSYTIDGAALVPGRYLVRVWASGVDANDPVSNQRHVTIVA